MMKLRKTKHKCAVVPITAYGPILELDIKGMCPFTIFHTFNHFVLIKPYSIYFGNFLINQVVVKILSLVLNIVKFATKLYFHVILKQAMFKVQRQQFSLVETVSTKYLILLKIWVVG